MDKHWDFLRYVRDYVRENPTVASHVTEFVAAGLQDGLDKAYERAADMEVALVCALSKRNKDMDGLILDKLKKWEGKTACNWSSTIHKLTGE